MRDIQRKGVEALQNNQHLKEVLTPAEVFIFKRANPRPKLISVPYIEIEMWTYFSTTRLKQFLTSNEIPLADNNYAPSYPFTGWYVHSDGSIVVDTDKANKMISEGHFPFTITPKNSYESSSLNTPVPNNILINSDEYKKLKELREYSGKLATLGASAGITISMPNLDDNNIEAKYRAYPLEISSSGIKDFRELRKFFYLVRNKGTNNLPIIFVNKSCGLHISFPIISQTIQTRQAFIKKVILLYLKLEEQIYEIVPSHRRTNMYCKTLNSSISVEKAIDSSLYEKYSSVYTGKKIGSYNFIEFRFPNATTDVNQIENWILFFQEILEFAKIATNEQLTDPDLHLFDVVTNLYLQDWFLRRREHLAKHAKEDKTNIIGDNFPNYLKTKLKKNESKQRSEKTQNSTKIRAVNSGFNRIQYIPRAQRRANAQATRRRIRTRWN